MTSNSSLCVISNIGWTFISTLAIFGSRSDPEKDALFYYRYFLALISGVLSLLSFWMSRKKYVGILSVGIFVPFIFLELAEVYIVYRCATEPSLSSHWGTDCSSLLVYREGAKRMHVFIDEIAVSVLAILNLIILWRCHIHGHRGRPKKGSGHSTQLIKPLLSENFTSFLSTDHFVSAEEDASPTSQTSKVLPRKTIFLFCPYTFSLGPHS